LALRNFICIHYTYAILEYYQLNNYMQVMSATLVSSNLYCHVKLISKQKFDGFQIKMKIQKKSFNIIEIRKKLR